MNAEAVKQNAQHSVDWDASAKAHREAGEAVVDLLRKMLERMGYVEGGQPKKQSPKR